MHDSTQDISTKSNLLIHLNCNDAVMQALLTFKTWSTPIFENVTHLNSTGYTSWRLLLLVFCILIQIVSRQGVNSISKNNVTNFEPEFSFQSLSSQMLSYFKLQLIKIRHLISLYSVQPSNDVFKHFNTYIVFLVKIGPYISCRSTGTIETGHIARGKSLQMTCFVSLLLSLLKSSCLYY